ncbi:hypothetical protein BJP40_22145 [Streptomyces sp. CC53]|nr:hypothetical protein BJP40_22145 [Streptomyces sp. CC53]
MRPCGERRHDAADPARWEGSAAPAATGQTGSPVRAPTPPRALRPGGPDRQAASAARDAV